ncbi:MAG: MmgE/PrpD family protein [Thermodesulfobacteriota bacterium]|jgi:2-methylcitrate dehydratase PrpD
MEANLGLTKTIARFIVDVDSSTIPFECFEQAKVAFLDWLAVLMAGKDEPLVLKLIHYAELMGGNPQATVLGHGLKTNVSLAALINGAMSHALDYDDTMAQFSGHPSVTLFPGLLALAEWKEKTGLDFLKAYIIGLKAGAVIGACAGVEHYGAGWHGTSTIGRLASAAGCARLLGLNEQQTIYALGIAGTQASGLKRVFGTMCKPYHAGRASQVGLEAGLLAEDYFTSAEDILEGPDGFFQLLKGRLNERAVASLGKTWDTDKLAQKYHASCHGTHSAIEAVLHMVRKENLTVPDIKSITVRTSQTAIAIAGKKEPKTGLEGKFSIYYCVANALLRGDTGMQAFTDEKVNDPEVRGLMKRIEVLPDSNLQGMAAKVEVETHSGQIFQGSNDILNEIPELEIKKEKVRAKFMDLCAPALGRKTSEDTMGSVLALEDFKNMKTFIERIHHS